MCLLQGLCRLLPAQHAWHGGHLGHFETESKLLLWSHGTAGQAHCHSAGRVPPSYSRKPMMMPLSHVLPTSALTGVVEFGSCISSGTTSSCRCTRRASAHDTVARRGAGCGHQHTWYVQLVGRKQDRLWFFDGEDEQSTAVSPVRLQPGSCRTDASSCRRR